ncbi:hypothetical protein [Stutzerimonas nitrititolerans]|uniref:hypothetical protein n=1 Tax=Stutzerimonas nitrititolerans TaxID=2482751 RepID=UPI00289710A9|nr:hypothetical protein [Stutzerimonas nitrititolerans]
MHSSKIRIEFQRLIQNYGAAEARDFLIKNSIDYSELAAKEVHDSFKFAYEQKSIRLAELSLKVNDIACCEKAAENSLIRIKALDEKILQVCQDLSDYIAETVTLCRKFIENSTSIDQRNQLVSYYDLRSEIKTFGPRIPPPKNIFEYLYNIATDRTAIVLNETSGRPCLHPTFESIYPQHSPMHKLFYSLNEEGYFQVIWEKLRDLTNHVIMTSPVEAYRKSTFISKIKDNNLLSAKHVSSLIFEVRDGFAKRGSEYFDARPKLLPSIVFHEDLKHCERNIFLNAPPPRQSSISTDALLVGDDFPVVEISRISNL